MFIFIGHVVEFFNAAVESYTSFVLLMDGWTFSERLIGVLEGFLDGWVGHSKGVWSSISWLEAGEVAVIYC